MFVMKSPFPGMDPYLEPHWLDVHSSFVVGTRDELNQRLPEDLVARSEERVAVESDEGDRQIGPHVRVFSPSTADPEEGHGSVILEAPFKLVVQSDPIIERFIRIIDEAGQLITVLEFISPTNKRPPGLDAYRQKRGELLDSNVHIVEIDLVRAGDWRGLMRPERCPTKGISLYRVTIRTSGRPRRGYLFPIHLMDPLPEIPIPLRPADPPVKLKLQPLLDRVYQNGRYGRTIGYRQPLDPPLSSDDAARVAAILKDGIT
jgi:hypothetical protein